MDHFRTQYEKCYDQEEYYWGLEPAAFLDELIEIIGDVKGLKALDIGCGEGKDIVYLAEKGFDAYAFDITESGIKKTKLLAKNKNVDIDLLMSINSLEEYNNNYNAILKSYEEYEKFAVGKLDEKDFLEKNMILLGLSRVLFTHSLPLVAAEQCYKKLLMKK